MALGWAFTTVTAIATTLSYRFERRRGLALISGTERRVRWRLHNPHRYWRASLVTSAWKMEFCYWSQRA